MLLQVCDLIPAFEGGGGTGATGRAVAGGRSRHPFGAVCYPRNLSKPAVSVPLPPPRWATPVLLALAALFLVGLFSTEFADTDAWWHLATGRFIASAHRLPDPDPFAFTSATAPPAYPGEDSVRHFKLTHEWLAQLVWYGIQLAGGFAGLVLWKALLLAATCALAGWVAGCRRGSLLWGVAAAMAAASLAIEFAHDRPSILSYFFTALWIAIFDGRLRLWLLPPLALVWANCHGGFFLGWVVAGAYAAEAFVRRAPDARRLVAWSAAAVLASALNPNGYFAVAALLRYRRSALQSSLIEWSRPSLWGSPYAFDLLLYGSAAVLVLGWRKVRLADWILFAAFAGAALMAFRNEMLVGVVAPVLIATYFPKKFNPPSRFQRLAIFAAMALVAAGLVAGCAQGRFFQLRAAEWRFPAGAATFLSQSGIRAPLFNTYEDGGYLIWRGERVFIDGRALSEAVFQDYRLILGTPPGDRRRAETLRRYGIGAILVNGFEYNSGALYPLLLDLAQSSTGDWKLVYDDPAAVVFVRDVPAGVRVLDSGRVFSHLEDECRMHVEREPGLSLCARTLGDLYLRSGDRERARQWLGYYLDHPDGDDPDARRAFLQLLGR